MSNSDPRTDLVENTKHLHETGRIILALKPLLKIMSEGGWSLSVLNVKSVFMHGCQHVCALHGQLVCG